MNIKNNNDATGKNLIIFWMDVKIVSVLSDSKVKRPLLIIKYNKINKLITIKIKEENEDKFIFILHPFVLQFFLFKRKVVEKTMNIDIIVKKLENK